MFDDPKKELRRLEEALLAEGFDEEYDPSGETDEWEPAEFDSEYDWESESHNEAVDFGRMVYADEIMDEDAALYAEAEKKNMKKSKGKKPEKKKKQKGVGGLVFLALLELFGIAWIVRWWILWLT